RAAAGFIVARLPERPIGRASPGCGMRSGLSRPVCHALPWGGEGSFAGSATAAPLSARANPSRRAAAAEHRPARRAVPRGRAAHPRRGASIRMLSWFRRRALDEPAAREAARARAEQRLLGHAWPRALLDVVSRLAGERSPAYLGGGTIRDADLARSAVPAYHLARHR